MVRVRNWERHQHYKGRRPPWIKLHRELLDDHDWHRLDAVAAKVLISLWLIASENDGELPDLPALAFRLRMPEKQVEVTLSRLSGWLDSESVAGCKHDASTTLAGRKHDAMLETETEKETEEIRGRGRLRASTLPDGFEIGPPIREWAAKAHPSVNLDAEFAKFRDYHTAKGSVHKDWQAAFRYWIGNCKRVNGASARPVAGLTPDAESWVPSELREAGHAGY